jgi:hypothetical protein
MLIVCYKTCFSDGLTENVSTDRWFVAIFAGENSYRKQLEKPEAGFPQRQGGSI